MTDEKKSLEEWMAEEQARLDKGFEYEPVPSSGEGKPSTGEEVLAGLGLGAAVVGGAVAPHPSPVTLEGVKAAAIVKALKSGYEQPHPGIAYMLNCPWSNALVPDETDGTGIPKFKDFEANVQGAKGEKVTGIRDIF